MTVPVETGSIARPRQAQVVNHSHSGPILSWFHRSWLAIAMVSGLHFSACDWETKGNAERGFVTIVDSAGIQMVTNQASAWGAVTPSWTLDSLPALSLTSPEGSPTSFLFQVRGVRRLGDGRVVVANRGSEELLVFNPSGQLEDVWGGAGEGPAELDGLRGVFSCAGDTLIALQRRRISVISPEGSFVRTVRTVGVLVDHPAFELEAVSPDCSSLLIAERRFRSPAPGERLFSYPTDLYWSPLDGGSRHAVGSFPGEDLYAANLGTPTGVRLVYGVRPIWDGLGDSVIYGPGDRFEFRVLDEGGGVVRIVRWPGEREAISQEEWERYTRERRRLIQAVPQEEATHPSRRGYPGSGYKPAYEEIISDGEGNIWVRQYVLRPLIGRRIGAEKWWVFDQGGLWLGEIQTPAGFTTLSISGGFVAGVTLDQNDIPAVELYRIFRE